MIKIGVFLLFTTVSLFFAVNLTVDVVQGIMILDMPWLRLIGAILTGIITYFFFRKLMISFIEYKS